MIGLNLAAGVLQHDVTDPGSHQYGTVTLIARALLQHNARPDPDHPPEVDRSNIRYNWLHYPILLEDAS